MESLPEGKFYCMCRRSVFYPKLIPNWQPFATVTFSNRPLPAWQDMNIAIFRPSYSNKISPSHQSWPLFSILRLEVSLKQPNRPTQQVVRPIWVTQCQRHSLSDFCIASPSMQGGIGCWYITHFMSRQKQEGIYWIVKRSITRWILGDGTAQ